MPNRKKSGFGAFVWTIIILALLLAVTFVGFKTYQKMPVITLVSNLAGAASEMDLNKMTECFTPDSDVNKAIDVAITVGNMPILGNLAGGAASLIGSAFDYKVDYSDIRITVDRNLGEAVIGVADNKHNQKSYLTLNLNKIDNRWYVTQLPSVKSALETDLSYKNTLMGYAERASDYAALLIFSAKQ